MCLYGFFELRTVPHGWAPVASAAGARWLGAAVAGEAASSIAARLSSTTPPPAPHRRACHDTTRTG